MVVMDCSTVTVLLFCMIIGIGSIRDLNTIFKSLGVTGVKLYEHGNYPSNCPEFT